jgi:hypothetical protein
MRPLHNPGPRPRNMATPALASSDLRVVAVAADDPSGFDSNPYVTLGTADASGLP